MSTKEPFSVRARNCHGGSHCPLLINYTATKCECGLRETCKSQPELDSIFCPEDFQVAGEAPPPASEQKEKCGGGGVKGGTAGGAAAPTTRRKK